MALTRHLPLKPGRRLSRLGMNDGRAALAEKDLALEVEPGWRKPGISLEIWAVRIRGIHAEIRANIRMECERFTREPSPNRRLSALSADALIQAARVSEEGGSRAHVRRCMGIRRPRIATAPS